MISMESEEYHEIMNISVFTYNLNYLFFFAFGYLTCIDGPLVLHWHGAISSGLGHSEDSSPRVPDNRESPRMNTTMAL